MKKLLFAIIFICLITSSSLALQKNTASQKWVVFAFNTTDNSAKTGDAGNITANIRIDGGTAVALGDTNPTELEDGYYVFDINAAESNGDNITICPDSTTSNIQVIGCPMAVWTNASINQTGDSYARLGAPVGASISADIAALPTDADVTAAVPTAADNAAATAVLLDPNLTLAMGYALAAKTASEKYDTDAEHAAAIWNAATASYGSAGSYGLLIETNLDAAISSRSTLTASDNIGINWADVSNPTTTLDLSGTTIGALTTNNDKTGYTASTVSDKTGYSLSSSQTFNLTGNITGNLSGSVGSLTTWDKTGYALSASGITAIWDKDISGYSTAGQAGTYLVNASAPSAASVADAVWDEVLSGHLNSGTTGYALNAASSAGDPWATTLPGAYGSGTAGYIIGIDIASIVADSNELQTDWHNGGRLDLMLDALQSLLNDIKRNTASGR